MTATRNQPRSDLDSKESSNAIRQDRVIAGGPEDFMEVRHLVLAGTNEEIGRALASLAIERFRLEAHVSTDRLRTRVQRRYIEMNYPILHDRMRGVASAFGKRLDDDGWNFSGLDYLLGPPPGCSVVYYPPGVTADGKGVVSRNYDYGTGTALDEWPEPGELPASSRPYLVEMHPDRGYASMALYSFDLLSGVMDGINSAGLTVTLQADDELEPDYPSDPTEDSSVGLDECQILRLLLDTCASVEEAKEALLFTKQYYMFLPSHYLIADRHGESFVWEYSHAHNREHIVQSPGRPLISTNFRLHQYLDGANPPSAEQASGVCGRYAELAKGIAAERGKLTEDVIGKTHRAVDMVLPGALYGGKTPIRTLWHALYFPDRRKVRVSFYLGEEPDPDDTKEPRIRRSEYLEFVLAGPTEEKGARSDRDVG